MMMKVIHESLECKDCKLLDEFYEKFNKDKKKDDPKRSYFGVISYKYISSDKKKEPTEKKTANICFLQLINEWTVRDLIDKRLKQENGLKNTLYSRRYREKKRDLRPKPSFYLPEHTGNLISIKKSESFTESSPEDTVCSDNFETAKNVDELKSIQESPSKEKVAPKEPRIGTLKRKRNNLEKLKTHESYEDDIYEQTKLKKPEIEDSNNSEEDIITSPTWSVQISPRKLSRTPSYEDCYSLTELQNSRKEAEEYQYRRIKRKKYLANCKKSDPEAVMKQDPVTYSTLLRVSDKVKDLQQKAEELEHKREENNDSEEDHYFSSDEDSDK